MIESLLVNHLKGFQAIHILDVGPGYGNFSRVAARITGAKKVTYLDCNRSVLEWQAKESKKVFLSPDCLSLSLDVDDLNAIEESYDLILCQEVLEHLARAEEVLAALARRLTMRGRIVITVPTKKSERWLMSLNPNYMKDEPYGHVREFDEDALRSMMKEAGLEPLVFIPTQPHVFVSHTWLYGSRMKVEGATGRVFTGGMRGFIWKRLGKFAKVFFLLTGPDRWGRLLPRNYFIVAKKRDEKGP